MRLGTWGIILLFMAAAGGAYFYHSTTTKRQQAASMAVVTPTRGAIEDVISAQGKLEPKEYVDVGAQVSGQLKKLHVAIGDTVEQGELIAEIDDTIYQARIQATEASLESLRAQLVEQQAQTVLAQQQYSRNQRLFAEQAVSQNELQATHSALKVAQARIASLRAQIEQAGSNLKTDKANLGYTKIYAPISGTVVTQTSREGQTLNANQMAPVIVQIANLDTMTVRAQVAEADILDIAPGMPVYFTVLGDTVRRWQAVTRQVLPSPEIINNVVLYNVLADVDNTDRTLMNGMTTQMFFVQGRAENALLLPTSVLTTPVVDKKNTYTVMIRPAQGKPQPRTVVIGIKNRTQAEILSGLTDGEAVIEPQQTNTGAGGAAGGGPRMMMGPRL